MGNPLPLPPQLLLLLAAEYFAICFMRMRTDVYRGLGPNLATSPQIDGAESQFWPWPEGQPGSQPDPDPVHCVCLWCNLMESRLPFSR